MVDPFANLDAVDPNAIDPRQLEAANGMVTENVTQGSDMPTSLQDVNGLQTDDYLPPLHSPQFGATSSRDLSGHLNRASQAEEQQKVEAKQAKDAQDLKEQAREGKRIYQDYKAEYEKRKAEGKLWPEETRPEFFNYGATPAPLSETQLARKLTGKDVEGGTLAALGDIYNGFQALTIDPAIKGWKEIFNVATTGERQTAEPTGITGLTAEEEQGRRLMETKQTIEAEDAKARGEGPEDASLVSTIGDMIKGVITDPNIRNRFIEDTLRDLPATVTGAGALKSLATTVGKAKMLSKAKKFAEKAAKANPKTTALAAEIAAETPVGVGIESARQASMGKEDIPVAELAAAEALISIPTSIGVTAAGGALKKLSRGTPEADAPDLGYGSSMEGDTPNAMENPIDLSRPTQEAAEIESKFETKAVDIAERNKNAPAEAKIPASTASDAPAVKVAEPLGTMQKADGPPQGAPTPEEIAMAQEVGIDVSNPLDDRSQGYTAWAQEAFDNEAIAQATSGVQTGGRKEALGFLNPKDVSYQNWVDEAWPVIKVQRLAEAEGKKFKSEERVDFAINELRGSKSASSQFIQDNLAPVYKKLNKNQKQTLNNYMTAKRAQWLYENKNGQIYYDAEGQAINEPVTFWDDRLEAPLVNRVVERIEKQADFPKIKEAAEAHWAYNQKLADMREESTLWTPEQRARIAQEPYYVPFVQPKKGNGWFSNNKMLGFADKTRRIRDGGGSTDPMLPPAEVMIGDAAGVFTGVAKQKAFNKLINAIEGVPELEGLFKEVPSTYKPREGFSLVSNTRDGKIVRYEVSKELGDAINNLGPRDAILHLPRIITSSTALFRNLAVGWNPDFAVANSPRDIQEGFFNFGYVSPLDFMKAVKEAVVKGETYKNFYRQGGGMESLEAGSQGPTSSYENLKYHHFFANSGWGKVLDGDAFKYSRYPKLSRVLAAAKASAKTAAETSAYIGEISEVSTRLAIYSKALKKGMSYQEAINAARQSTVDFNRAGRKAKNINTVVAFFNAAIQGIDTPARTIVKNPKAAAARWAVGSVVPMLGLTAWNVQNPYYEEIPRRDKERYWILMKDKKTKGYYKIAKPHSAATLINPIQMWVETEVTKTMSADTKDYLKSIARGVVPISDWSSVLPPVFLTPLEQMMGEGGYNSFFEREIVRDPLLPAGFQADPNTSRVLKTLGKTLGWSPARLEHIARGLGAGTASNLLWVIDTGIRAAGWDATEIKWKKAPFLKRIAGEAAEWRSDLATQEKELINELRAWEIQNPAEAAITRNVLSAVSKKDYETPEQKAQLDKYHDEMIEAGAGRIVNLSNKYKETVLARKSLDKWRKANGLITKAEIEAENE